MEKNILFNSFARFPDVLVAMSLREDKNMKAFYGQEKNEEAFVNREKFLEKINISGKNLVSVKSVSGSNIEIITEADAGNFIKNTDGLITARKNVYIAITVADCLPLVLFDPNKEAISLLHCGWKGIEKLIIEKAIQKMHECFNSSAKDIVAGIGPGIGPCHFEVKNDLIEKFASYPEAVRREDGKTFMDLKLIAKKKLMDCGLDPGNIDVSAECTYCQPGNKYFSFRKDKSMPVLAMIVIAGMVETN